MVENHQRTPEELEEMLKEQFADDIDTLLHIDYWEAVRYMGNAVGEWWASYFGGKDER